MRESATFSSTSFKTPTLCNGKLWQLGFQVTQARGMRRRCSWWETPNKAFTVFAEQSHKYFKQPKTSSKIQTGSAEPYWRVTIPTETRNRSLLWLIRSWANSKSKAISLGIARTPRRLWSLADASSCPALGATTQINRKRRTRTPLKQRLGATL